jgi:hypothetical protein
MIKSFSTLSSFPENVMPIPLIISLIPIPKNSCLDIKFVLINVITSAIVAEL